MIRAFVLLAVAGLATSLQAQEMVSVTASPTERFNGTAKHEAVDGLIWRGGLTLSSPDSRFGGLSGLAFINGDGWLVAVSDRGQFLSGRLELDAAGAPVAVADVAMSAIQNSQGADLPRQFARDAEAVDVIFREGEPVAVRVGYEHLTRVADFSLTDFRPGGAAREIALPAWLTAQRHNGSIESLCIAPPASPVAGSTLIITENVRRGEAVAGYMIGIADRGDLLYRPAPDLKPTDCAFLPDGDLLVLERGVGMLSFSMRLARVPALAVRPESELIGDTILSAAGGVVGNMEGLGVRVLPSGEVRITLISDDNHNAWLRTVLLEFSMPG